MTKQEAAYWKRFIYRVIEEKLPTLDSSTVDTMRIKEFAKQHMATITGQQMLPQAVFREFLQIMGELVPGIELDIERLDFELEVIGDKLNEATKQEVEQMFDGIMNDARNMNLPSMEMDGDGYVALNIDVDANGIATFNND